MNAPGPPEPARLRDAFWFQTLLRVLVIGAVVMLVLIFLRRDVVTGWREVAVCPAVTAPSSTSLSATPDLSMCSGPAVELQRSEGLHVVPFILPATAGTDASVTRIVSAGHGGELVLEYRDGSDLQPYPYVIVFVALQDDDVPTSPFRTVAGSEAVVVRAA